MVNPYVVYSDQKERVPDRQYRQLLSRIKRYGVWYETQSEEPAKTLLGVKLEFPFVNGAPIITQRDVVTPGKNGRSYISQALGEITGFVNGAHTHEQLKSFGCYWWKDWVNERKCAKRGLETGDLGPGSYGAAWTHFPTPNGDFNQINAMLAQIKEKPHLRTHLITPWIPQFVFRAEGYEQKVVVVPCHGWVNIRINTRTRKFTLIHHQRSADIPVGFPANMIGYCAFALMVAKVTGFQAERIIYWIDDAHYYKSQQDAVEELLAQKDQILPTMKINTECDQITGFRSNDFVISDYYPTGPRMVIPTPE